MGALLDWRGSGSAAAGLLIEGLVIAFVFYLVFPRSYVVFSDRIGIMLGGPVSFRVGFDNIRSIAVSKGTFFGVSFATRFASKHVEIARLRGLRVGITPRDPELFAEQANRALEEWRSSHPFRG